LHVDGHAPEWALAREEHPTPPAPTVRSPLRSSAAALADTVAKLGARIVSSQRPYGCTVSKTVCKEGITKMDDSVAIAGIDVSKDKLDVHLLPSNLVFTTGRDPGGLSKLCQRLHKAAVTQVALEASGDYERTVIDALEAAGLLVQLLNPMRVRRFAEAAGKLAKTDPIDARLIALYARHFPDKGLVRRPEQARKLGEFLGVRSMLLGIVNQARSRLEHLREPALRQLVEQSLADATARLKLVQASIAQVIAADEAMHRKAQLIRSFIGAGPVLASNLLARVPELGCVSRRHAAHLCAVAPADRQSGKSRRRASIEGGRDHLRPLLHMVALTAMRSNPVIRAFANRLTAAGKAKRLVLAACARKIIVILNAMLRDQTRWYHAKAA
jgi:transposase